MYGIGYVGGGSSSNGGTRYAVGDNYGEALGKQSKKEKNVVGAMLGNQ